jgi:hypothetical protein
MNISARLLYALSGLAIAIPLAGCSGSSIAPAITQSNARMNAAHHRSSRAIDQFSVSGSSATLAGTTMLNGTQNLGQFWIPKVGNGKANPQGTRIVAADRNTGGVSYWNYPAGGTAFKTITNGLSTPYGVTISPGGKIARIKTGSRIGLGRRWF